MNPAPRDVYVPTRLPDGAPGAAAPEPTSPAPVFTPGAGARERTLAARVREALRRETGRRGGDGSVPGLEALFRSPEVAREVVERLSREARDLACTAVVAPGPGGGMIGAPLAVRAGLPLFLAVGPGEGQGDPLGADDRVLVVADVADSGDRLAEAANRVEQAGARVAAVAAVVEVDGGDAREIMDDRNLLSVITL